MAESPGTEDEATLIARAVERARRLQERALALQTPDLGILEFEAGTTSDIDQAILEEQRRQAGLDRAAA